MTARLRSIVGPMGQRTPKLNIVLGEKQSLTQRKCVCDNGGRNEEKSLRTSTRDRPSQIGSGSSRSARVDEKISDINRNESNGIESYHTHEDGASDGEEVSGNSGDTCHHSLPGGCYWFRSQNMQSF